MSAPTNDGISDNKHFAKQFKGLARYKFWLKIYLNYWKTTRKVKKAIRDSECYYGPFKGEFGHFTAHTLPFISFLHSKGVKVHYCGMELHRPIMVDDNGNEVVHTFHVLRDFFAEVSPSSNNTIPPEDVQEEIEKFRKTATASGKAFFDIGDDFYYWYIHRNWLLRGPYTHAYKLEKVYGPKERENSIAIFPRSKGAKSSRNNGEPWDYPALIDRISRLVDKVYVCGHPSQVLAIEPKGNIELCITSDNAEILKRCSRSKLIITQHSGVNNLGEYTGAQVLIIYKGQLPIGSVKNTQRFRPFIAGKGKSQRYPLDFAYSDNEVIEYVEKHFKGD